MDLRTMIFQLPELFEKAPVILALRPPTNARFRCFLDSQTSCGIFHVPFVGPFCVQINENMILLEPPPLFPVGPLNRWQEMTRKSQPCTALGLGSRTPATNFFCGVAETHLVIHDSNTNTTTSTRHVDVSIQHLTFSPDGRTLIATMASDDEGFDDEQHDDDVEAVTVSLFDCKQISDNNIIEKSNAVKPAVHILDGRTWLLFSMIKKQCTRVENNIVKQITVPLQQLCSSCNHQQKEIVCITSSC